MTQACTSFHVAACDLGLFELFCTQVLYTLVGYTF